MKQWLLLAFLFSLSCGNPGLQLSLSGETINEVLEMVYELELSSPHFDLGDYEYKDKTDLGDIDMKLTNITINSISLDRSSSVITLKAPNVLTYTLQGLQINGSADYDITIAFFHLTPGNATFALASTNATVSLTLTEVQGKPQIAIGEGDFSLSLGDAIMKTQLPNEFNDILNKEIRDKASSIAAMIPSLLAKYIPLANEYLLGLPTVIQCPVKPLAADISITLGPEVVGDLLVVGLNGTIIADGHALPLLNPASITPGADLSEGIQVALTDPFVNSLLATLWSINYDIDSLPDDIPLSLDTTSLSLLVPQLAKTYGQNRPVQLTLFTAPGDRLSIETQGTIKVTADISVTFWVYSHSNWVQALTLDLTLFIDAAVSVSNNIATASIKQLSLTNVDQVFSAVGTVNTGSFASLINALVSTMLPMLNSKIPAMTIPLPDGLGAYIKTDEVKIANGYIILGVDLNLA